MIKSILTNRIVKRELGYLLEVSSIKWKINPNIRKGKITLKSETPNYAFIEVTNEGAKYKCADPSKERELKKIVVGVKFALQKAEAELEKNK